MNSIVRIHTSRACSHSDALYLALVRLGEWIEKEADLLRTTLVQGGRWSAVWAVDMLNQLHVTPDSGDEGLRSCLDHAAGCIEALLAAISEIPMYCQTEAATGIPGPAAFDMHVRWCGARLTDILSSINGALRP